jgi:small conductance mechanosensitive channel
MHPFVTQVNQIADHAADRGPQLLVTLVVGLIVVEVLIFILGYALRISTLPDGLKRILFSLLRAFLWIILLLVVLQTLGLNNVLVAVTGSSVIAAVFLSTGVAPIIIDVLAGLTMASDKGFQPGAKVRVGDQKTEGVIESMDLRKTRLRDSKGILHVIPNSLIDKNEWVILAPKPKKPLKRRRLAGRLKRKR